ncbi:MAG TPA: response regulator transcription factor, partial [Bryobacteraceae bacterium]|nr:response regulator transcription factor [Bryobacteraceae bacterium]
TPARSLEGLAHQVITESPAIVVVDKVFGVPVVIEWLANYGRTCKPVVWGSAMSDSEALRFLKSGARGVIRKTAETDSLLACFDAVAAGETWMEDVLFQNSSRCSDPRSGLTPREQEVLELVEQGYRNKDIARELGIQPGTVKIHMKHIFEKTGVRGRFSLALSGLRLREEAGQRIGF